MALREKFGRLVLLHQTDSGPLGNEYRAARLGPAGFDRLVTVLRFSPAVSGHEEASKRLVEEARIAAQVHSPGFARVLGVGRVNQSFYMSTELVEGRSISAILALCAEEGFPFGADHVLMIASRVAAGLELLHGRKDESGRTLVHGLVSSSQVVVAFDGEVKLKGLGLWPALGATELLAPEERAYLAPEQLAGTSEPRSDVYALGLVLLEALSGQPPDGGDLLERIATARIASPGGEPAPLPKPLADLLRRALSREPASRFPGMAEMRRAIDAQLFTGDFTPTTFGLAFFMHTLFRDAVERDAQALEEERTADYREFLAEEAANAPSPASPFAEPVAARAPVPDANDALADLPAEPPPPTPPDRPRPAAALPTPASKPGPGPDASQARIQRVSREAAAREAASRPSHGQAAPRAGMSRGLGLVLGLVAAVVVGGGAGFVYFVAQRRSAGSPAAPSPEQAAAEARVRQLEARIAQLEREKAEAETRAAEEAGRAVEQQATAGGRPADPAAIARAQEEARQRARAEQDRKQQEELKRLAEEQRLAAAAAAALATPPPTPAPTPTAVTTPTPAPPVELSSAVQPAAAPAPGPFAELAGPIPQTQTATPAPNLVPAAVPSAAPAAGRLAAADPSDPAVRPPGLVSEDPVPYPRRAMAARIATVVVVRALVDETGRVVDAALSQPSGQPAEYGFDETALKRVRSRKYRPARRNDVPVPIWVVVRVEFRPPPPAR